MSDTSTKCYINSIQYKKIQLTTIFQIVDNMECDTCGESFILHDELLEHLVVTQHGITHDDGLGDTMLLEMDTG